MIKFEIEVSKNFRGGNHYCFFEASSVSEVLLQLERSWNDAYLNSKNDEAFLLAHPFISGKSMSLMIGDFVIDEDMNFTGMSSHGFYEWSDQRWEELGFNFSDGDDEKSEELFEQKIRFLFEKNSPDKLLGSWLVKLNRLEFDTGDLLAESVFAAHIIKFSDTENKLIEMYNWLISEEGKAFLLSNDRFHSDAFFIISELQNAAAPDEDLPTNDSEKLLKNLRNFAEINYQPLPANLSLEQ
jgi:hypothetical protein